MASLLRSGKFLRLFSSNVYRNFEFHNGYRNNSDTILWAQRKEWETSFHRSLSSVQEPLQKLTGTTAADKTNGSSHRNPVDAALEKANYDVQKSGRVSVRDLESIVNQIVSLKSVSPSQGLLLIRCCGKLMPEAQEEQRTKLVHDIWKMLEDLQVMLDISHYNALLRVYLDNEHKFDCMGFLKMLEEKNIEPNRVTYQRLLASYCQKGIINGASNILQIMKNKNMPISETVFNALVMGHTVGGDMESALGVIKVMSQAGLEPNGETYSNLLSGYAKLGLLDDLTSILEECEKKELFFHHRDLLEVLFTAAVHEQPQVVDFLLSRMPQFSGYHHDCVNIVLRLVNRKKEDEAFKVLLTMKPGLSQDGQTTWTGSFFIRQIVKANCPPDKIVAYCERLVESGLNNRAFLFALETSNAIHNTELSAKLLKHIKAQKDSTRPSLFWPLLSTQSKIDGEKGVLEVLKQMTTVLMPNVTTIHNHVLPYMENAANSEDVLRKLRSVNVPRSIGLGALVVHKLNHRDFSGASELLKTSRMELKMTSIIAPLAHAYLKTLDGESVVTVMLSSLVASEKDVVELRAAELAGAVIKEVVGHASSPKSVALEPLLQVLLVQGFGVSETVIQHVHDAVGDDMTDSIAALLSELNSNKRPLGVPSVPRFSSTTAVSGMRKDSQSLAQLVRERKLDQAAELKRKLEEGGFFFSDGRLVLVMDLHTLRGELDEALAVLKELTTRNPSFIIQPRKILQLAMSFFEADRTGDVFTVLQHLKIVSEDTQNAATERLFAWRLINFAAEKGDIGMTERLFDVLVQSKTVAPASIVNALVKVHMVREDVEAALKAFTSIVNRYKLTAYRSQLTQKLIETENAVALQQLMEGCVKVHGEINSLYDLVFCFLESGRVRQAKKIFETPGLYARNDRLMITCQRYVENRRISELENLVKITKDVAGIDRRGMMDHLLSAYMGRKDVSKALGVWMTMQEENLQPSEAFLWKLGKFLENNQQPVPFTLPEKPVGIEEKATTAPTPPDVPKPSRQRNFLQNTDNQPGMTVGMKNILQLMDAIKEANIDGALEIKQRHEAEGGFISWKIKSSLLELLLKNDRLEEATEIVMKMLREKQHPLPITLMNFFSRLVDTGDVNSLMVFDELLSTDLKRLVGYDKKVFSILSTQPKKAEEYLDSLIQDARKFSESQQDGSTENTCKGISISGVMKILEKNPNLVGKCKELAEEHLKRGLHAAMNGLWCYFLMNKRMEEAHEAWKSLTTDAKFIHFFPITNQVKINGDADLAQKLVEFLSGSTLSRPSTMAPVYSSWISVLVTKNMVDEASNVLDQALRGGVTVENLHSEVVEKLKALLEQAGKEVPFTMPERM